MPRSWRSKMGFARRFGVWFAGIIAYILTFMFFIPMANFKLTRVIILGFQNLDSSFTYWDLVTPGLIAYWVLSYLTVFVWTKKK